MNENIVAKGKIFELVQLPQPDGRVFEVARRAPGVRVIIADQANRKLLLSREFRRELGDYDYRLPGGKVFDTLDEYAAFRASGEDIAGAAKKQAVVEAREEAGIEIAELELYKKSVLGTTVEWDLYVFVAANWQPHTDGQQLTEDEVRDIAGVEFYGFDEVRKMIFDAKMQEDRIAMILLRWLEQQ